MRVVIDTNLLFSAIVKPDGRIAEIILNPLFKLELMGCYFSYIEIFKHKAKLLKLSKLEEVELLDVIYRVFKRINFVNESHISAELMQKAYSLTFDVDEKDTVFVAMSHYLGCKLWSGDVALRDGLRTKGYTEIITTDELLKSLL
jgi:predicted nucleic acid-binding protein